MRFSPTSMGRVPALLLFCIAPGALAQTPEAPPTPVVAPAAPAVPAIENNRLVLNEPITFQTGSDTLTPGPQPALSAVKAFLDSKEYVSLLRIEGHTDNDGDAAANLRLSQARASAAARWLIAQGVDCKRLLAVGFGGTKPVAANDTPENKSRNRRTEAHVAMLRGRAIGGMPVDGGGLPASDPCTP